MQLGARGAVYGAIFLILLFVLLVIPVLGIFDVPKVNTGSTGTFAAEVTQIRDDVLQQTPRGEVRSQTIVVKSDDSQYTIKRTFATRDIGTIAVSPGDKVLIATTPGPNGTLTYYIADYVRAFPLWLLTMSFVAVVLLVGGTRGAWSLLGMVTSLLIIVRFVIPGILSGASPLLISIIGALLIMLTTIYLAHGVNPKATVALLGTALSLVLTGVLAVATVSLFRLSGLTSEDATTLAIISAGKINANGLLLGSIIIGGLGVLADITIGQASAVFELRQALPGSSAGQLFRRGMNVGRDHVAAVVNTLVLAYAGASLPLLIILSTQTESVSSLLNREFMATEIVRTLVASIGILAAVPLTTALAALAATGRFDSLIESFAKPLASNE